LIAEMCGYFHKQARAVPEMSKSQLKMSRLFRGHVAIPPLAG